MLRITRTPHILKVGRYTAHMVEPNEYLDLFLGLDTGKNICKAELNEIVLHSMPNGWAKQDFIQSFYFETSPFKEAIYMFDHMEIAESIYEGGAEPSDRFHTNLSNTITLYSIY